MEFSNTFRLCGFVSNGDHLGVKRALNEGADPNTCMPYKFPDKWGGNYTRIPVLTVAAHEGHFDVVCALLEGNVNTEYVGDFDVAPLAAAIREGNIKIVEKLINHGADVKSRNAKYGGLPINNAAIRGCINTAKILQAHGCPLDNANIEGMTPLHLAAWNGQAPMAKWLVQQGLDVAAVNFEDKNAADVAESCGHNELATCLRSCVQDPLAVFPQMRIQDNNIAARNLQLKKKVYILNYITFPDSVMMLYGVKSVKMKLERRDGAKKDSENLHSTFVALGYEVILRENMNEEDTHQLLNEIQQDQSLKFLLLFVLSHGVDGNTFFTSDGAQYCFDKIQYRFTDSKCPQLKGKDKIILSNFCRGENIEKISTDAVEIRNETPHNMITVHASHEGFKATRSSLRGTLFVHNLCEVIKEKPSLPLLEMLNHIYDKMEKDKAQTPELKVSLPMANFTF